MSAFLVDRPFTSLPVALERLEAALSPLVGIVTRIVSATHTTDEAPLPNCAAELGSASRVLGGATVEWGSGAHPDPARARAAALGEAIERYSAMYVPGDGLQLATARALGRRAVAPSRYALFHAIQHALPRFPWTPFTEDTPAVFVEGTSLSDGSLAYLPAELVYLARPWETVRPIAYSTSNGLACAASAVEATLAAALEVVERDAVMLAWKCGLSLPLLDVSEETELVALDNRFFASTGLRYATVNGSRFLDVPVAIGVVHGGPDSGAALALGAGSAATAGEAWLKALAESFGVYRWLRTQRAEGPPPEPDAVESFEDHMRFFATEERAALATFLDESDERTATTAVSRLAGTTPGEQLSSLVGRLAEAGLEAYAVDVTSPDVCSLDLSVVRVVVPELCALDVSHRARFLGGDRLYTAAYDAGLATRRLELDDLNPLPHPFP